MIVFDRLWATIAHRSRLNPPGKPDYSAAPSAPGGIFAYLRPNALCSRSCRGRPVKDIPAACTDIWRRQDCAFSFLLVC